MDNIILMTQKLTKDFGGLRAVNELDLKVKKGEIHALIGPNGSGKSTTLNLLSGIYPPSCGNIILNKQRIDQLPIFRRSMLGIGRTFQNIRLFDTLTVFENTLIGLHCRLSTGVVQEMIGTSAAHVKEKEAESEVLELCKMVGLSGRENALASSLPYGDRRMLEIARSLASKPSLLLLDEPFAGMSPVDADRLVDIILAIKNMGTTVILVEHHMRVVMKISDTVSVLNFGLKIAEGSPDEIKNNPEVIEAYLGKED